MPATAYRDFASLQTVSCPHRLPHFKMRRLALHQLLEQAMLHTTKFPGTMANANLLSSLSEKHSKSFLYSHLQRSYEKNIPKVTGARLPFPQTLHNLGSLTNKGRDVEVVLVILLVRWGRLIGGGLHRFHGQNLGLKLGLRLKMRLGFGHDHRRLGFENRLG